MMPEVKNSQSFWGFRKFWFVVPISIIVLGLDQLSKVWAILNLENMSTQYEVKILGHTFFELVFVRNPGAALSIGSQSTYLITLFALSFSCFFMWWLRNTSSLWWVIVAGLMLGGALGNLMDRVFRTPGIFRGHVVDFIAIPNWAVINVADIFITTSAMLMIVLTLLGVEVNPSHSEEKVKKF